MDVSVPYLALVVDNSCDPRFQKFLINGEAALGTQSEDPMVMPLREKPFFLPIADRGIFNAAQRRRCPGSAQSGHDGINTLENFAHKPLYSGDMNNVKVRNPESPDGLAPLNIWSMAREIPTESLEAVALRLRAARMALDKSQREVCRNVNVQSNTWNQWEKGAYTPDVFAMGRFADLYGISLDWIYRGRPDSLPANRIEAVVNQFNELLAAASKAPAA